MPTGWRIVPAHREADAFVGEGAKIFGGRWNPPDIAVVYASQHKSLAILERLVHRRKVRFADRFKVFSFSFEDALVYSVSAAELPPDWQRNPAPPSTQQFGAVWIQQTRSAVLAVPSAIIPEELNYLLNPEHPDFTKISVKPPHDFVFDPRLL